MTHPEQRETAHVYYVSPEGCDAHDGLSPEAPLASIERVTKAQTLTNI